MVQDPRFPQAPKRPSTLGDKLHRLAQLSPDDIRAIETLVDDLLMRRQPWPPKRERWAA